MKELRAIEPNDYHAKVTDSFGGFTWGLYRAVKFGKRYDRPFGTGVSETIDDSVWQRWKDLKDYRPPSLFDEAKRRGLVL